MEKEKTEAKGGRLPAGAGRLSIGLLAASAALAATVPLLPAYQLLHRNMSWNLLLALVPLGAALLLSYRQKKGVVLNLLLWVVWLLFMPNAPYLATDLAHLGRYTHYDVNGFLAWDDWQGLLHFVAVVAVGMTAGCLALYLTHKLVARRLSKAVGWLFVAVLSFLCGAGVYMGRFLRFNSWDALREPLALLREFFAVVDRSTWGYMASFAAVMLCCYGLFYLCFDKPEKAAQDSH